ncbi:MAG: tetraether lipid synthase Tes [Candidatus Thermoplasmatota archaeon]
MIIRESTLPKGLPKRTSSICPECGRILDALIVERAGAAVIEKECPEHGKFSDIYWSDVNLYLKADRWAFDGIGVENPPLKAEKGCPYDCGLCDIHLSHTSLANLDLTNRCNLRCPVCFANANAAGYVYEPSLEQVKFMLRTLRAQRPVPCPAVQFAGGEPTIYPHLFEAAAYARELGFSQVQVATNGLKMAAEPGFTQRMVDAGVHTVYLQFDGLREENYVAARGRPLLEIKKKALESCRHTEGGRLSVVLVPTILNGVNNDQLGEILRFAIEHREIVRGVNFQPVAFTGRIAQEERERQRFTLTDMVHRLKDQTGVIEEGDWYNVPFITPLSEFISVLEGEPKVAFTSHPHCGLATYLFIDESGSYTPITRFIDVEGLITEIYKLAKDTEGALVKFPAKIKAFGILRRHLRPERMPKGLSATRFLRLLESVFSSSAKKPLAEFSWSMMFVGGMHFQDAYNYDIERVKRCVIHYVVPDGRIIPFCAYNGGPTYRTAVEKQYSVPLSEWKARYGAEGV